IDLAAIAGRRGEGAGVRPARLPGPVVARLPDRLPAVRVETEDVLAPRGLALRVGLALGDDEPGVALTQRTRPQPRRPPGRPRVRQASLPRDAVVVGAAQVRPVG